MSIRKASAQTAINRGTVAAATATTNQITIAPATATSVAGGGSLGVLISNVAVTDATFNTVLSGDTAVSSAGGFVRVTGSGFRTGANVFLNNVLCSNSFVSSTQINATIPASANGSYVFSIFNPDGSGGTWLPGLAISGPPAWTQTAYTANSTTLSIQLLASGDTPLTYYIQPGSSNPQNLAVSSTGLLTGTVPADGSYSITVIVDDAQSQSTQATVSIAVSTTDPYFNLTTLALPADTGANVWIADASTNKFNLTVNGDTRPTKFSPYYTQWAVRFNSANTDHLALPFNSVDVGANNFVLEAWIYVFDRAAIYMVFNSQTNASTASGSSYGMSLTQTNGFLDAAWYVGGATYSITGSTSAPLNQWNHVALVRTGGTMSTYLNGVRQATRSDMSTNTINAGSASFQPFIGRNGNFYPFNGFISDFRIVIGTHPYDATSATLTVPTSRLTAITNTAILTCNSNRFVDTNTQAAAKTITVNNTPQVSTFAPFSESDQNIGSGYFDGTGDYLNGSITAIGTNDFSVEFWAYLITHSGLGEEGGYFQISAASGGLSTSYNEGIIAARSGAGAGRVLTVNVGGTAINTSFVLRLNEWFHTVITRVSNTVRIFVNGVLVSTPTTVSTNLTGTFCSIGGYYSTSYLMLGYIADCRVIVGTGFTSITVPTSPLTAVANTRLLTLQYPLGENNHRFVDESANKFFITRFANATQGTFTPFSQTGWSNYFGGDGNYLSVPYNAAFSFSTGDFSIECFANVEDAGRTADANKYGALVAFAAVAGNNDYWGLTVRIVGGVISEVLFGNDTGDVTASGLSISLNQFHHFVACRTGTTLSIFVDGVRVVTATKSSAINANTSGSLQVARSPYASGVQNWTKGYISNVRVVKGASAYSASSTTITVPTTPLTAISGTSLLTCQSNRFVDNSTNNFTVTPTGTPSVQAFSPFAPAAAYSVATVGGSGYFDGTGDYLTVAGNPAFAFGTGDFTVAAWIYPTAATTFTVLSSNYNFSSGSGNWSLYFGVGSAQSLFFNSGSGNKQSTVTTIIPLNAWTHVAYTRVGTTSRFFVNGTQLGGTISDSFNYGGGSGSLFVGQQNDGTGLANGYITNIQVLKGTGYSSLPIPTAPATNITNTSLLLNFTNSGITDATGKNVLEAFGEARVSLVQSKFGSSSMAFDGSGDYLALPVPSTPYFTIASRSWTLEAWLYLTSNPGYVTIAACGPANAGNINRGWSASLHQGLSQVLFSSVGADNTYSGITIPLNQWFHYAFVYNGTNLIFYINGVNSGSQSPSLNNPTVAGGDRLIIGANYTGGSNYFPGYIDDFRFTNGFARYTANFTPPTETFRLR
jgi:hypothetical protein